MRAIITVVGKDMVGILAKVSTICADRNANVIEVTQTILQDLFAMIMLADIQNLNGSFYSLSNDLVTMGEKENLQIHVMHEDIFNSMHRI